MVAVEEVVRAFRKNGVSFFTGVPDSLLKHICACFLDQPEPGEHIITPNEGNAIALAMGHHLATDQLALVYLQNSGLGNIVNPLLSLADPEVYRIPMVIMIGWRGEPGKPDEPQHRKQGRVMLAMLEAMEYRYFILDAETEDPAGLIEECCAAASEGGTPVMLLVRSDTFMPYTSKDSARSDLRLSREEAIQILLEPLQDDTVVISTTGKASREVFEHRAARRQGHHRDFLTVGGMGHASLIALGIALRSGNRPVLCIDGDGAALMHLGAFSTIGTEAPPTFKHVVLNNGAHDSVGGQPSAGFDVDLCRIALAAGYRSAEVVETEPALRDGVGRLMAGEGPALLEVRVRKGARPDLGRPTTSPVENKQALMGWLGAGHERERPE